MPVCRRDGDRQRKAVLIDRKMDFDALDLLAAIEAAPEASRRRMTGPAVDDDGAGIGSIAAGPPPGTDQAVEQPAPQTKPGPAGEQGVERAERNVAQLANRPPLHAAEPDAPDRHDRLAQRRSSQGRLRSGATPPRAVCRHGRQFRQHRVDEGIDVTESIPRGRRSLGGVEGGAHMLRIRWLLAMTADIAHRPPARQPLFTSK
jgi:hypothetical protein